MKKKILCLTLIMAMLVSFMSMSFASVNSIISIGKPGMIQPTGIKANKILGTVVWIGYISAIGMIIWCGIKYVMSGAAEKAKAKETIVPILGGAILITMGSTITLVVFRTFGY